MNLLGVDSTVTRLTGRQLYTMTLFALGFKVLGSVL